VNDPALVASRISRHFGAGATLVVPVDGVDLELWPGELALLIGPSGSGKSTLLHLCTGFDRPNSGTIEWSGVASGSTPPWSAVSIVPQSLALLDELTMFENVAMPLILDGCSPADVHDRVEAAMSALAIDHLRDRVPRETSLGQQQRAAVARAVVVRPRLLLADEPTSHQDEANADVVMRSLSSCVDGGTACLIAGHDPRLVTIAHRRISLLDGHVSEERLVAQVASPGRRVGAVESP